jgi:predicted metal-binding membrane protein
MSIDGAVEATLRRDRLVVSAVLLVVIALSWAYVLAGAGMSMPAVEMTRMGDGVFDGGLPAMRAQGAGNGAKHTGAMSMILPAVWTPGYASLMFLMWWTMMIAMMLPSASPMVLLFATVNRRQRERGNPHVPTALFALGYLTVWAGFSVLATVMQWGLAAAGGLSSMMVVTSRPLCALILIAAGVYQFTPLKRACLAHCRSPLHFLSTRWRNGARGALRMGVEHGAFCVGCCWFLMLLLFAGGIMNLYWVGGLALFVLLEKLTPPRHWLSPATGVLLLASGAALLL